MASEMEVEQAFDDFRKHLTIVKAGAVEKDRNEATHAMIAIGIWLLEGFLIDIKRIADAQSNLADQGRVDPYVGK